MANSLKQQIRNGIVAKRAFDRSRHADKHAKQARYRNYSKKSERSQIRRCYTIIKLIRERHEFREIREIRREMIVEVFTKLASGEIKTPNYREPYAASTIQNMVSAMQGLQCGLKIAYPRSQFNFMDGLTNPILEIPSRDIDKRRGVNEVGEKSFTPDEARAIIDSLRRHNRGKSVLAARVVEIQLLAGLREGKEFYRAKFDIRQGKVWVKGKSGRWRPVRLAPADLEEIYSLRRRVSERTVQRWVAWAVKELGLRPASPGPHGFRGAFAIQVYEEAIRDGADEKTARSKMSKALGHNRTSTSYYYMRGRKRPTV